MQAHGQQMVDPLAAKPVDKAWVGPGLRLTPALNRPPAGDKPMASFIESDELRSDADENVLLTGNASTRRQDAILKADVIDYNKVSSVMDGRGHGRLIRDGSTITGPEIHYDTENGTGTVNQPNFWLESGGSGIGSWADIFSRSQMSVTDVTYSGCPCPNPAWYMQMDKLDLDFDNNEGVARNGVLYFKDVPILASPYLTFPIKKERKSGFLIPTFASTSTTGFDYTQPYYFNLQPNYDATLVSRTMSKRGEQIGGEFRWMNAFEGTSIYAPGTYVRGQRRTEFDATLYDRFDFSGTYLNNDLTTQTNRWLYSTNGFKSLDRGFYAAWSATGVSDPNYFQDFAVIGANQIPTTILPRMAMAGWADGFWSSSVQYLTYQTLSSVSNPVVAPYNKVPEVALAGNLFNWHGLDLQTENTATQFDLTNSVGVTNYSSLPVGQRFRSYTQISYPVVQPGWYVTPKLSLFGSQYNTDWKALTGSYGQSSNTLMLPLASIDAGMRFERDTKLFNNAAIQTIEPRVNYLYVPYQNQAQVPVYDTTLADLSYSQLFQENIYSGGWDRVANANQITTGVSTRFLDADTGFERLTFAVAQQYYMTDQLVTLPYAVARTNSTSSVLFENTAAWTDKLGTAATLQYNPYSGQFDRSQLSARWKPQRQALIAASWRYQVTPTDTSVYRTQGQNQISVSGQWPLGKNWYTVGRIDYSFVNSPNTYQLPGFTQMLGGLEYKSDCCWAARVVLQRYALNPLLNTTVATTLATANTYNTAVFLQLELSGLGALGSNPMGLIAKSVVGYENPVPMVPNVSKFERYE
ncbi:LPS-assembly protein [Jezberella montanilacus]|uniref:LPS-assembly protein LptD n=2 Tax=Jezberella montanilacus TaxID=323426 RepID=A0A2T0XL77_9BURK|nr:LPS-assembly protein [Jezberella montanilacus]